ncbi:MAG: HupE/UreJ family protein [Acidobacteriota bacterium]
MLLAILAIIGSLAWAHDIATDVKIQAYVKPEGARLRVVLRVPVKVLQEPDRHNPGSWVSRAFEVMAGTGRFPAPKIAAVRTSPESDRSFVSYADALAHVTATGATGAVGSGDQGVVDILLEYPLADANAPLSVHTTIESFDPQRAGLKVLTVLWFLPPSGSIRAFEYLGDPGWVLLDPSWTQAALRFVALGFEHILDGIDHLLFLFCLIVPFRKLRPLLIIVTSFTVAHSITLIASAFNLAPSAVWFPHLIEVLIAVSILYMAVENVVGAMRGKPVGLNHRWIITFGFGLVHGFGFSFALRETLQFAGSHLVTSLLAFNVGVELGQMLVLAVLMPALWLLFRNVVREKVGVMALSATAGVVAAWWMVERWVALRLLI